MRRHVLFGMAALVLFGGCARPTEDAPRPAPSAEEVQQKLRDAYTAVRDYAFAEKDKYVAAMNERLAGWDEQIAQLKTEVDNATGETKKELSRHLAELEKQREAVATRLQDAQNSTGDLWEKAKSGMDSTLSDFKDAAAAFVKELVRDKPDQVLVHQRSAGSLPGLDGKVKVQVGDIKRGQTADVEILGPDGRVLASQKGAKVGDRIRFEHDGKSYDVEAIRYYDELVGNDDFAVFRVRPVSN